MLRAPRQRAEVEKRYAADPQMMTRNASRFKDIRRWSLLGSAEYGTFPRCLSGRTTTRGRQQAIYTLPVESIETRWAQTDALAATMPVSTRSSIASAK